MFTIFGFFKKNSIHIQSFALTNMTQKLSDAVIWRKLQQKLSVSTNIMMHYIIIYDLYFI